MKREDKILKLVNKTGYGVEIGPATIPWHLERIPVWFTVSGVEPLGGFRLKPRVQIVNEHGNCSKKAGYQVQIIDQMNREQLLAHYQGHGQPLENIEEVDYVWCFTPSSFRLLIHDLYDLGLSPFKECVFFPTVGCEFFVTLGRKGNGMHVDRLSLLKKIKAEWAS